MVQEQIAEIERERDTAPTPCEATECKCHLLLRLKSIGPAISALLSREVYYRQFANRRQVGSFLGLTPSPYNSGEEEHCQGISAAPAVSRRWRFGCALGHLCAMPVPRHL
jgi:transposase